MKLTIEGACVIIVTACASYFLVEGGLLEREARLKVDDVAGQYVRLVEPGMKAEASLAAAGLTIAQVGAKERSAFDAQQKYFEDLSKRTNMLLDSANETIKEVNQNVIPRSIESLSSLDLLIRSSTNSVESVSVETQETIAAARPLLEELQSRAADLRTPINDGGAVMQHGAGIAANLEATTGDIKNFVHRETTPVRGTWNIIKAFLKEFAGPLAQTATAVK